jgi:GT2 family glycosyltransferase
VLSVVVPTHDTRDLTLRCLASVLDAPGRFDVVLVDDGSRDGTAEAARARWPALRVLRHESARGFSAAANAGLRAARGALLWLLNSDTLAPADAYERLNAAFAANPRLGIAGAELIYPDGRPQWSGGRRPTPLWLFALSSGLPAWRRRRRPAPLAGAWPRRPDWVTGAALALRREVWERVGPLDEGYRFYAQDVDLCLRARRAGFEVDLVPGLRVVHHLGASIGRRAGAFGGAHPELLWADLRRCVERLDGPAAGRLVGAALRAGARLRLAARGLRADLRPPADWDGWERDSDALRRALRALGD